MSLGLPSHRAAWLFLSWGILALSLFGIAAHLTKLIVYVNPRPFNYDETPTQDIGIFVPRPTTNAKVYYSKKGGFRKKGVLVAEAGNVTPEGRGHTQTTASFIYDERSKESFVEFKSDALSGKIILNNVAGTAACVGSPYREPEHPPLPLKIVQVHKAEGAFTDGYLIAWDVGSLASWSYPATQSPTSFHIIWIRCGLNSIVKRVTYTERIVYFRSITQPLEYRTSENSVVGISDSPEPAGLFGEPTEWTLDLTQNGSMKNVQFRGGTPPIEGRWLTSTEFSNDPRKPSPTTHQYWTSGSQEGWERRDVGYQDLVEVRWDSLIAESYRDIVLVIIGAFVALGAAMGLEAIRPFVERIVEKRNNQASGNSELAATASTARTAPRRAPQQAPSAEVLPFRPFE